MTNDKRWCSQHQGYIANVGGKEKPVQGGLKKRWICARCCGEHAKRTYIFQGKTVDVRRCVRCGSVHPVNEFEHHGSYVWNVCRICRNEQTKHIRNKNIDKYRSKEQKKGKKTVEKLTNSYVAALLKKKVGECTNEELENKRKQVIEKRARKEMQHLTPITQKNTNQEHD